MKRAPDSLHPVTAVKHMLKRVIIFYLCILMAGTGLTGFKPAHALSITGEEKLAREFMKMVRQQYGRDSIADLNLMTFAYDLCGAMFRYSTHQPRQRIAEVDDPSCGA